LISFGTNLRIGMRLNILIMNSISLIGSKTYLLDDVYVFVSLLICSHRSGLVLCHQLRTLASNSGSNEFKHVKWWDILASILRYMKARYLDMYRTRSCSVEGMSCPDSPPIVSVINDLSIVIWSSSRKERHRVIFERRKAKDDGHNVTIASSALLPIKPFLNSILHLNPFQK
jgi:hypothetical protein